MKRGISVLLLLALVLPLFSGCKEKEQREISCEEVIAAYEEAGYTVYHREEPEKEFGYTCLVSISQEDGDAIYFHFYETNEEAEAYAEERQWNVLVWLFTWIYGDPSWLTTETYRNIEIEYDDKELYKPFKELIE